MPLIKSLSLLELDGCVSQSSQSGLGGPSELEGRSAEVLEGSDLEVSLSEVVGMSCKSGGKHLADLEIEPLDFIETKVSSLGLKTPSSPKLNTEEINLVTRKFAAHVKKISPRDMELGELWEAEDAQKALEDLDQASLIEVGGKKILLFPEPIGQGAKGEIFLGITADGKMCAIKRYFQAAQSIEREADLLAHCAGSPHIIQKYASDDRFLVLEFCRYSLDDFDYQSESLDPYFLNQYTNDILGFLVELFDKGVIHLDIKPDNLRARNGHLKLLDFDTAFFVDEQQNVIGGGTIGYYDPKQIAYYCQINQAMLEQYRVPGFDGPLLEKTLPTLHTNTWQAMITLAEFGFLSLSPAFQARFEQYRQTIIKDCAQMARMHIANSAWLERSGLSYLDFQKKYPAEFNARFTLLYMGFAHQKFEALKAEREGLFAGLVPETPLEQLLIEMSYFDEDRRLSPETIRKRLQEDPVWIS